METVYLTLSRALEWIIEYSILLVDLIGVCILIWAVGHAIYELCRRRRHVRLHLAEGIALSLEFKMGGELLRTGLVRDWRELITLGAIILLRAAMTFLIQWEIKIEKRNHAAEQTDALPAPTEDAPAAEHTEKETEAQ